eukprot:12454116-Alexandrium_andersonii.AAC.1
MSLRGAQGVQGPELPLGPRSALETARGTTVVVNRYSLPTASDEFQDPRPANANNSPVDNEPQAPPQAPVRRQAPQHAEKMVESCAMQETT